jgi:phage terminase small subunit
MREARKAALAAISSTAPAALPESAIDAHVVPAHLSPAMQDFWRRIAAEHELKPDHVAALLVGCQAYDRAEAARRLIARDGVIVSGKRHPATDVMVQAEGIFLRALREIAFKPDAGLF